MKLRLVAVGMLVLTACAGDPAPTFPDADPAARTGGTITVGIRRPQAIDPVLVSNHDPAARTIVETMCDPLVQLDPVTGEPVPALAESWTVTDGGRRLTMRLRENARFHDGRDVTADDVAHSLFRLASEETASPVASLLRPVRGWDEVHGEEVSDDGTIPTELVGVQAVDRFSFEITLTERMSDFVRVLSHPATVPVSEQAVERSGFSEQPVCSGPYKVAAPWKPSDGELRVERVAGHRGANLGYTSGGSGYADEIVFRIFPDVAAQAAAFAGGELDVAEGAAGSGGPDAPSPILDYVGLPNDEPPFDRRTVRVAFSRALDRKRIASVVYDGGRTPAGGFLPPAVGDDVYRERACGNRAPLTGDVTGALALLGDDAATLRGTEVKLYFNDEFRNRALLEEVAAQWTAAFGIVTELVPMAWERYLATGTGQPGFEGPFRMSWAPEVPTPDDYLFPLFESSSIGRDNLSRFSNRDFDQIVDREARRAIDDEDRRLAYQALEDIACGEMPVVPIAFGRRHHLVKTDRVGSARETMTDRTTGDVALRELYVRAGG